MPRPVQQVKFRLNRTVSDWATSTEMVREASALPGYVGPSVEEMERIGRDIGAVREQLRDWIWATAAKEARSSSRRESAALRRILGSY
jgi:hypothetical protein